MEAVGVGVRCPACGEKLTMRTMPQVGQEHWHCSSCLCEWKAVEIIEWREGKEKS